VIPSLSKTLFFLLMLIQATLALAAQPFPAGDPQAQAIHFQFALYYPAPPTTEPMAALRAELRGWPKLVLVDGKPPSGEMMVHAMVETAVRKNYAPPDMASLKYFGRGLSQAQMSALQGAKTALILDFAHPKQHTLEALRSASAVAAQVASVTGGLLWDEETREVFTPEAWRTKRLSTWTSGVPDLSNHIVIHAYQHGELVRAESLGMAKFGLPDLALDQFPWSTNSSVNALINVVAQSLAEGAVIGQGGQLDVDARKIVHPEVRARQLDGIEVNAQTIGKLTLMDGPRENGDSPNRIAAISAARYPGPDVTARQAALLAGMFGSVDGIKYIEHDDELEAASVRAQKKLAGMEADFKRGLRPGEYIQAKAPFATPAGGHEWMWVEIQKWDGDRIDGVLRNDPYDIPTMHSGQAVRIKLSEVFDYTRVQPDGSSEGNTTGAIIEKMQGRTRK
jgi:hypothetical protein